MRQVIYQIVCLSLSLALTGCQSAFPTFTAAESSPLGHQVVRDQLIINSDFLLPNRHRLVEEIVAQREVVTSKLELAATDEPIHVYLFSDEQAYHNFIDQRFPDFADRRAIFAETDIELSVYAHWGDHVAEDLRHEISHGYLHAAIPNLPFWLDEGLAEYFEVGRGQRGVNRTHLDYLAAKVDLEDWQPALTRLEELPSAASMTQADYAEAWAWVHFLLESGDKAAILTEYLSELRQDGTAAPISTRIGKRLAGPELAMLEHLQSLR